MHEFYELRLLMANLFEEMGNPLIFPSISNSKIFKNLPFFGKAFKRLQLKHYKILNFFTRQVEEHIKRLNLDNSFEPMDFVEAFLRESKKDKDSVKGFQ